jgi:hypothetical protein
LLLLRLSLTVDYGMSAFRFENAPGGECDGGDT